MNGYRINQVLDLKSENGIWLDYRDHTWFFMIKDDIWQPEEIQNAMHKGIKISFLQKGIVDIFLIEVNDCLETSDVPFCLLDATKDLYNSFKDSEPYQMTMIMMDHENRIKALRSGTFSREFTRGMKRELQQRRINSFDERSYSAAYTKMARKYEPFEMEQFAQYTQMF